MPVSSSQRFDIAQKHRVMPPKDLLRMLQQAECDSSAPPFAILGPVNEAGPDWLVILEIDQQKSTGAAKEHRWLVIQGQSKGRMLWGGRLVALTVLSRRPRVGKSSKSSTAWAKQLLPCLCL